MSLFLAKTQKDIVAGNMFISSENKRTKLCRPSIIPRKLAMLFTCPFQQPATFVKATLMKTQGLIQLTEIVLIINCGSS